MNKKLLALAIAGAFASPVAMAATGNVEIYGTAAVSVENVDGGSGGSSTLTSTASENRMRVSNNTSIIGFKGSEDLGNGLSAIWQIENNVAITETAGGTFAGGRETFAGLAGKSWGSLTLGLRDTAYKVSTARLDVYSTNYLADYRSLFGGVSNGSIRAQNSVTYISPKIADFTVRASTAAMQEDGSNRKPHLYSVSGTYENGPLFVTLAHEDMKFAGTTATGGVMFGAGGSTITAASGDAEVRQKQTRLGAGYTFGDFKVGAAWERTKVDVAALGTGTLGGNVGGTSTTARSTDRDAWYLSGAYKIGANTLKAAYTRAGELEGTSDTGAQQWSLGVDHTLSKRTNVYALYTQVLNDSNAAYNLGGAPVSTGTFQSGGGGVAHAVAAAAPGQDPRGISIGMIHKF